MSAYHVTRSSSTSVAVHDGEQHDQTCESQQSSLGVIVATIGLATDFYDFGVVNNVKAILEEEFGRMTTSQNATLSASALIGAVIGQICIGLLADRFGRRAMFMFCSLLTCLGALFSAMAWNFGENYIYWLLIFFRFIMGIGIGGEYPCCASHTAETSNFQTSGRNMALSIAAAVVGLVCAPALVLVCLASGLAHNVVWRLAFGFGALLSMFSLVLRISLVENSDKFQAVQQNQTFRKSLILLWENYRTPLFGTAGAWFLYDVVDYGLGLYSAKISGAATGQGLFGTTLNTFIFSSLALPGAYAAAYTLPYCGRKTSFQYGFLGMLLTFIVLVVFWNVLPYWLFIILYGLQLTFDKNGPAPAAFATSGEIFPTAARATAHGISAASGKLGAVVGVYTVGILADTIGVRWMLLVIGCVTLVAMLWVQVMIPDYNENTLLHLEEVAKREDAAEIKAWLYGGGLQGHFDASAVFNLSLAEIVGSHGV